MGGSVYHNRDKLNGIARLQGATAEHFVDPRLHVAILVARMALLEGPPVIAEDLLEGVFVDPLPCGGLSAGLDHVLAPRSTRVCTLLRPPLPIVSPCRDGQKGGSSKRKFLYAQVNALRADFARPSRAWRSSHLALKTVLSALAVSWAFPHLHQFQRLVGYLGGDHKA